MWSRFAPSTWQKQNQMTAQSPALLQLFTCWVWWPVFTSRRALLWKGTYLSLSVYFVLYNEASLWFWASVLCCRYFFIACPLLDFIRKTKTSVLVCLLVWTLCVFSCPLEVLLQQSERIFIFALFPAPLFICCLAGTLRSLPDATSVPSEEKQRIIGTLVLLLISYCLIIIPTIILIVLEPYLFDSYFISIFSLLNSFEVLILFVIMCRGPVENALACLCCCSRSSKRSSVWVMAAHTSGFMSARKGKENKRRTQQERGWESKQTIYFTRSEQEPSFTKMCMEYKICA